MKKTLCFSILLLLLSTLLAACNSGGEQSANADGKVEIDFFHRWPNEPRKSFYDEKIKEYMEQNPDVHINVDYVLNDAYKEKVRVLVSSDELPDIFTAWSDSFAENLVSSERIMPLNDVIQEDEEWSSKIIDSQFGGFTFDDTTYGIPFTVDGKAFFYNKAVFEENNIEIPTTYDELIAALDKLQAAGFEQPLVEGLTNTWAISHYLGTIFERVVDPAVLEKDYNSETAEFTDPGYVQGLEMFNELTSYMGEVSTAIDHEAARNMFAAGEVPILYMQFAEIKMVEEAGDVEFGFFDFPEVEGGKGDPTALTGAPEGWMVSKNAPEETIDFLKFLTSEETAADFTKTDGQLNAIEGAVTEENVNPASLEAYELITNASSTAPWFDNAVNINVADVFMRGGQSLATGQTTPEDILKEAQQEAENQK
ncbi:raffinose/stachyose/melibiose transport system substrate-binding protein [Planomicrobium stackebrandtii]|uniref:Raffinose/stachyose/melibiose transport system substrate-binding protein n=1 Tax=Planomicrobium stackebrandtii TaxID=253160 RepID=A0ABU0GVP8_9BACL|nr:extracellular solute-binding protein [Planomicrobium stackebrandtii]MDQ0429439.1 raffinose/stachyose/melibiose transport system substrate-binding protein [Planomicrobium stackebrandtii]